MLKKYIAAVFFLAFLSLAGCYSTREKTTPESQKNYYRQQKALLKKIQADKKSGKDLASKEYVDLCSASLKSLEDSKAPFANMADLGIIMTLAEAYAKDQNNANKNPFLFAFGLVFQRKYQKAAEMFSNILKFQPDNYGSLLMLGILSSAQVKNIAECTSVSWTKAYDMNPMKTLVCTEELLSFIGLLQSGMPSYKEKFLVAMFDAIAKNKDWWTKNKDAACVVKVLTELQLLWCLSRSGLFNPIYYKNKKPDPLRIDALKKDKIFLAIKNLKLGLLYNIKFSKDNSFLSNSDLNKDSNDIILIISSPSAPEERINLCASSAAESK